MPDVGSPVRRDTDAHGKLSTSTIIIIAVVSAAVLILVLALFAWRLLARSCRRPNKVPLPPVQDLAHHREQQLAAFADRNNRPTTWVESELVQPRPRMYSAHFLSPSGSSASLIRSSPDSPSRGTTRESSWMEDTPSAEGSPYPFSPDDLIPPNPPFLPSAVGPHISMASVASSSSDGISDSNVAIHRTPSEQTHSVESSTSLIHSPKAHASPARPRPSRSRPRSRTMSVISSAGTAHSLQSVNMLRGPAHSIHSNVQIVLPSPLASGLYPSAHASQGMDRVGSFYGAPAGDRRSVADQWVNVSSRPTSMRMDTEANTGKRSRPSSMTPTSRSRPRSSLSKVALSSWVSDDENERAKKARRSESQPPVPRHAPAVSVNVGSPRTRTPSPGRHSRQFMPAPQYVSPAPPVPRVPARYHESEHVRDSKVLIAQPPEPERGRARHHPVPPPTQIMPMMQPLVPVPMSPPSPAYVDNGERGNLRKKRMSIS